MKPAILFVCLGNICRSPLAEAVMRSKYGHLFSRIDSAGTCDYHIGEGADARMCRTALSRKVDLSKHRARQFAAEDFDRYDYILAMDGNNLRDIRRVGSGRAKVEMFLAAGEVPDPYFGGADGFEKVFDIVESACDAFVERIS